MQDEPLAPDVDEGPPFEGRGGLTGSAAPLVRVRAKVNVGGLQVGEEGTLLDDDETRALLASGRLELA